MSSYALHDISSATDSSHQSSQASNNTGAILNDPQLLPGGQSGLPSTNVTLTAQPFQTQNACAQTAQDGFQTQPSSAVHSSHQPAEQPLQPSGNSQLAQQPYDGQGTHQPQIQVPLQRPSLAPTQYAPYQEHFQGGFQSVNPVSVPPQLVPYSSNTMNSQAPTLREEDVKSWKYRGYPSFCNWAASDDDFFVLRRFGRASARVAFHLQDQIVHIEEQLKIEDESLRDKTVEDKHNGTFRFDESPLRRDLIVELANKLERYQRFLLDHSALKARPNASAFQIKNVTQWLKNANRPIREEEVAFLNEEDDLIPVVPKQKTPIRRLMDRWSRIKTVWPFRDRKRNARFFKDKDFEMRTTIYNRDSIFDKTTTCLIMVFGLGMLIGPLWWLQNLSAHQPNLQARLIVITCFLVLFTVLLGIFTVAKPFEVLAATAAYGAVLMVFMQLGIGGSNN
ncbi:hypothetical protein ACLMJK_001411 [Lecanora helva]